MQFLIFIVNLILLNFVCLKFSFNFFLKFYFVIILIFQDNEVVLDMEFIWKHFF